MLIRPANLQDADMLARVHVDTWRQAYTGIVPADFLAGLTYERSAQRWRDRLSSTEPGQFVCVAENDAGQVIGFASGGPERDQDPEYHGEVYALYVRPEHQRHHLGRRLVQASIEHLRQNGIDTLLIWVLAQNPARRFYESLGGQPVRERTVEIGGATLPEVGYGWRDLTAWRAMQNMREPDSTNLQDEIAVANERHWNKMVQTKCGYTIPWLDLNRDLLLQFAAGQLEPVPDTLIEIYPPALLANVEGQAVLCLASGGGQQSTVFGLLGARVTVVDLAEGQLDGDRQAAAHYGYPVTTLKGDMRDLSGLREASFDLVYQGTSIGYVPDVRQVFAQAARVLKRGGLYRVDFQQPVTFSVAWNGAAYCITKPYADKINRREDGAIEFRHYLSDIFNGLIGAGFFIEQVHDEPHAQRQDLHAPPGSWAHEQAYVSGGFAVIARKS